MAVQGDNLTPIDAKIIALRGDMPENGMSCIAIAERLGISEGRVWAALRRNGRQGMFRAYQRPREQGSPRISKGPRYQPVIFAAQLEKLIHRHGSCFIEEAAGGGYIVSFGDEPGIAQDTIGAAIRDAAEAAEIEWEEEAVKT